MFEKIKNWYNGQSDTAKALLWVGLACLIGIILRWESVVSGIARGFRFYSGG